MLVLQGHGEEEVHDASQLLRLQGPQHRHGPAHVRQTRRDQRRQCRQVQCSRESLRPRIINSSIMLTSTPLIIDFHALDTGTYSPACPVAKIDHCSCSASSVPASICPSLCLTASLERCDMHGHSLRTSARARWYVCSVRACARACIGMRLTVMRKRMFRCIRMRSQA